MNDSHHVNPETMVEPAYPASPTSPPNTTGEYLVCWRRPHWPPTRADGRAMFHTYAKAVGHRAKLEAGERRGDATALDAVFVTIHWRPCRGWREIA